MTAAILRWRSSALIRGKSIFSSGFLRASAVRFLRRAGERFRLCRSSPSLEAEDCPTSVYFSAMAYIDKHPPGSFCWFELATTDQNAAKNFYTALFGWAVVDNPMGPEDFYSMFKLEGRDTAAAYTMRKEQ